MTSWERKRFGRPWQRAWFCYARKRWGNNGPYLELERRTFRAGWKAAKR